MTDASKGLRRVLVVADVSAERVLGGAERMLVQHLRALKKTGYTVSILTRQPNPQAPPMHKLKSGVVEHRLRWTGGRGLRDLLELQREARNWWQVHAGQFDLIVSEQPFVMWALQRAGCRLPRLHVCHSFAFEEYITRHALGDGWRQDVVAVAIRHLERQVYARADHLMVLSNHMRQHMQKTFSISADHITVNPGGASRPRLDLLDDRETIREQLGWKAPVVITLRNLVPRTGVDLLVQAAAMLAPQIPALRWCVIGDGPLMRPLTSFAASLDVDDRIEFTGFLPEAEVHRRLLAADVFLLPTRALEGFGLVTVEANMFGLPVVATPVGANVEVVSSLPHNMLAENASPLALARALERMFDLLQHGKTSDMRETLRREAGKRYGWEKHDAGFLAALRPMTEAVAGSGR